MKYINWSEFVINKKISASNTIPENSTVWKDTVTGTVFYILKADYDRYYRIIAENISRMSADEIVKYMDGEGMQNSFPYIINNHASLLLRDASRIFVLLSYIYYGDGGNKHKLRKDAYDAFFSMQYDKFSKSWEGLNAISDQHSLKYDSNIKILKGGSYKIKRYYLENNDLKDMRGASYLLKMLGEKLIPDMIRDKYIEECIIYAGGGNLLAVLPDYSDPNLPYMLERMYHNYTLSAQNAFIMVDSTLKSLFFDYKKVMRDVEQELEERKRIKIYNSTCPESPFLDDGNILLGDEIIKIDAEKITKSQSCKLCRSRTASYKMLYGDREEVCGSCLHKHLVGRKEKHGYFEEFRVFAGISNDDEPQTMEDIKDKNGYAAAIYGDGNNFGAIVQNVGNLAQMMYFSRKVRSASKDALYLALKEADIGTRFEIVAIGGDDIFTIVPGEYAIDISIRLIELFNDSFKNYSAAENENMYGATLSVGVCIGKYNTPIRLMLEHAEELLTSAKEISRVNSIKNTDDGSMDFIILDSVKEDIKSMRNDKDREYHNTLLPYTLQTAKDMTGIVRKLKQNSRVKKVNLYNMLQAVEKLDLFESMLFYDYNQARHKGIMDDIFKSYNMKGLKWFNGYYKSSENSKPYSPWKDILDLWDFCGGGKYEEHNSEEI